MDVLASLLALLLLLLVLSEGDILNEIWLNWNGLAPFRLLSLSSDADVFNMRRLLAPVGGDTLGFLLVCVWLFSAAWFWLFVEGEDEDEKSMLFT